ncbi:hypothetical protein RFI_07821, partial [Reticulomyxa filosa]
MNLGSWGKKRVLAVSFWKVPHFFHRKYNKNEKNRIQQYEYIICKNKSKKIVAIKIIRKIVTTKTEWEPVQYTRIWQGNVKRFIEIIVHAVFVFAMSSPSTTLERYRSSLENLSVQDLQATLKAQKAVIVELQDENTRLKQQLTQIKTTPSSKGLLDGKGTRISVTPSPKDRPLPSSPSKPLPILPANLNKSKIPLGDTKSEAKEGIDAVKRNTVPGHIKLQNDFRMAIEAESKQPSSRGEDNNMNELNHRDRTDTSVSSVSSSSLDSNSTFRSSASSSIASSLSISIAGGTATRVIGGGGGGGISVTGGMGGLAMENTVGSLPNLDAIPKLDKTDKKDKGKEGSVDLVGMSPLQAASSLSQLFGRKNANNPVESKTPSAISASLDNAAPKNLSSPSSPVVDAKPSLSFSLPSSCLLFPHLLF